MSVDMSPEAVGARLREVGRLSDLRSERRLDTKVDMSPEAVSRRLEQIEQLRRLCLSLRATPEARKGLDDQSGAD